MARRRSWLFRALGVAAFAAAGAAVYNVVAASAAPGSSVTSISPSSIGRGAARAVTIKGTGFKTSSVVFVSGNGVNFSGVQHVGPTMIKATMTASLNAGVGSRTLHVVTNGTIDASLAGAVRVNAHPALTSISPNAVAGSGARRVLTLTGAGFEAGAKVTISGGGFTTGAVAVLSPSLATVPVTTAASAALGLHTVTVTNPDLGRSDAPPLLVVDPLPTINIVSVTNLNQGETTTATISGEHFQPGVKVDLGQGVTSAVQSVSPTQITVRWTVSARAKFGQRTLTVVNPDTGSAQMTLAVGVDYGAILTKWAVGKGATSWVTTLRRPTFETIPTFSFTGSGVSVTHVTLNAAFQAVVTFTVSPTAAATWRNMKITEGTTTWLVSRGLKVRLAPVVKSVTPLPQGATTQTIAVKGANFEVCGGSEPIVAISGTGVTINSVNAVYGFLIYLNVTVSPTAPTGARDVTITNCDSGGAKTSAGVFTITS